MHLIGRGLPEKETLMNTKLTSSAVPVLVAGGGPVGLTVAIELARRGVPCRVLDSRLMPRPGTRGCTVWQGTLELLDQIGVPIRELVEQGVHSPRRTYHIAGCEPVVVQMFEPDSRHPLPLLVGQDVTERFLARRLESLGVRIERGSRVVASSRNGCGATVEVSAVGGSTRICADWVVVAQGSHSPLREQAGIDWSVRHLEGTELLQVDARLCGELHADPESSHLFLGPAGSLGSLPLPDGWRRLFAGVPAHGVEGRGEPALEEVEAAIRAVSGLPTVTLGDGRHAWRVRLYNGIASTFRAGRCILVGDSARTVVPVTAQGMNTGLADAVNLGWKLAAVVSGRARASLIDTYTSERRGVALSVLHRAYRSYWGGVGRMPPVEEVLASIQAQRSVRTGMRVRYDEGPLTRELLQGAGARAGERVPDAPLGSRLRLHDLLRHGGWTLLVFAESGSPAARAAERAASRYGVVTRTVSGKPTNDAAAVWDEWGYARAACTGGVSALCLVRPDGHIGLRAPLAEPLKIREYLDDYLDDLLLHG
jgi:2-polyprenyl-6-methoxyphenol hydroxylase-like FAD-dependent oxidoreductase